jgi:hypothetical protein
VAKDAPKPKRDVKLFEPWAPPPLELPEVAAIQAVAKGEATPDQQQLAMRVIVEKIGCAYEETYCPGQNGARDSDFYQGRRRAGTMLRSFINAKLKNFKDPDAAPTEQG